MPIEAVGTVYGEDYASALLNRVLDGVEITDNGVKLLWRSGGEDLGLLLTYINMRGEKIEITVSPEENETLITDAVPGKEFTYCTFTNPKKMLLIYLHPNLKLGISLMKLWTAPAGKQ